MIKIQISEPIPSLNKTLKAHWSVARKRKLIYENQIIKALLVNYTHKERQEAFKRIPRKVHIHSQRARTLDVDNLFGGGKGLIDALRACSLIVDDNKDWLLELNYTQDCGKPYFTKIVVE